MAKIRYIVEDVDKAIKFYVDNLGFKVKKNYGSIIALLTLDDLTLILAGPNTSATKPMLNGEIPHAGGGWSRLLVEVTDIDSTVMRLIQSGVTFRNNVLEGPGGKQVICEDPSGNIVEISQPSYN